jgi:hypothetical protein
MLESYSITTDHCDSCKPIQRPDQHLRDRIAELEKALAKAEKEISCGIAFAYNMLPTRKGPTCNSLDEQLELVNQWILKAESQKPSKERPASHVHVEWKNKTGWNSCGEYLVSIIKNLSGYAYQIRGKTVASIELAKEGAEEALEKIKQFAIRAAVGEEAKHD